jgi:putative transposase
MLKSYKYRLYPNINQSELLNKHFGSVRFIYNWALDKKIKSYQNDKQRLTKFDLDKQLTELKKNDDFIWLKEVNSQSLQASNRHLDAAFTNFFRKQNGFPKFKSKHDNYHSFEIPQSIILKDNRLIIPKFKEGINIKIDRPHNGEIRQATISKTPTGKYFVSILCETNENNKPKNSITEETTIGIDLGVKDFIITSNGFKYENHKFLNKSLKKLKREQRKLSRKVKGSNNRNKQRIKVAKIHEKISNRRIDNIHKISSKLVSENQTICIEDLNIKGMVKNHKLARSINDVSWGMFLNILQYKSEWNGVNILKIGRFEPSSKMCSCGVINNDLTLKDRVWSCNSCGVTHERDILAANNIKRFALNALRLDQPEVTPTESKSLDPHRSRKLKLKNEWIISNNVSDNLM